MNTSVQTNKDILGFFELDDDGVVRYSRTGVSPGSPEDEPLVGKDFFDAAIFRNSKDLRRMFKRFIESREAADSFPFDCHIDNSVIHTKVTLTRAFLTEAFPAEGLVMLSIRERAN